METNTHRRFYRQTTRTPSTCTNEQVRILIYFTQITPDH